MWTLLTVYILGGLTFLPLVALGLLIALLYLSSPIGDLDSQKFIKRELSNASAETTSPTTTSASPESVKPSVQGWVIVRRTFEEPTTENTTTYVGNVLRSFLDSKQSGNNTTGGNGTRRPKDTFYAVLKSSVLYLYEDESCTDCHAALQVSSYDVGIWPKGLLDGELFAKRNGIRLITKNFESKTLPVLSKEMKLGDPVESEEGAVAGYDVGLTKAAADTAREEAFDLSRPYFMFVKSNTQMEDWYLALVHASNSGSDSMRHPLAPLAPVFSTSDMCHLVQTLDLHPDPIPMRWLNALLGRLFFSLYKTDFLESFFIGRIMKKISKVPRPAFLTDLVVREVSIGHTAPFLSKPMLKELTKEGDASVELGLSYRAQNPSTVSHSALKGGNGASVPSPAAPSVKPNNDSGLESGGIRIIVEATVTINLNIKSSLPLNLGARFDFKPMVVKLVLAVVLRSLEGNLLVKVKRPPSNRIWYGFTSMPKMELELLPIVSDRKIKWGLVLKPIENLIREVIQESVVLPNMDDIPFFDTDNYPIRGGIFADAVRAEYDFSSGANEAIPATLEPKLEVSQSVEALPSASTESLPHRRSPSPEPATVGRVGTSTSLPVPPKTLNSLSPPTTAPSSKKPSWFSRFGAQNNESTSTLGSTTPTLKYDEDIIPPPAAPAAVVEERDQEHKIERPVTPLNEVETMTGDQTRSDRRISESQDRPSVPMEEPSIDVPQPDILQLGPGIDIRTVASGDAPTLNDSPSVDKEKATTLSPAGSAKFFGNTRKRAPTLGHHTTQSVAADFFSPPRPTIPQGALNSTSTNLTTTPDRTKSTTPPPRDVATDTSPSPPRNNSSPRPQSPTPAAAFIAAWKNTKTGADKQALVASAARDAMRKWGFGMKKDAGESSIEPRRVSIDRADLVPPIDSMRVRTLSSSSNASLNGNPAPLTKQTAGGYWGEGNDEPNANAGPSTTNRNSDGLRKSLSNSGLKMAAAASSSLHPIISMPTEEPHLQAHPETSDTTLTLTPSRSPQLPATPIHVRQPGQAAMMKIPGIHSSHKGEVMAMGSPLPPLPPPAMPTSSEDTGVGQKLQNVYRLFQPKDAPSSTLPITSSSNPVGASQGALNSDSTLQSHDQERPASLLPASSLITTEGNVRHSNNTTNEVLPTTLPLPEIADKAAEVQIHRPDPARSAAAALKHIASLDELARRAKNDEQGGVASEPLSRRSSVGRTQVQYSPQREADKRNSMDIKLVGSTSEVVGALNSTIVP